MAIEIFSGWNKRPADDLEQQEPYRTYYFICEGSKTEPFYFKSLISNKKELDIHSSLKLCLLERTEADKTNSHPKHLLKYAENQKRKFLKDDYFDRTRDKMIIIFDADRFEYHDSNYTEIIETAETSGNILGITNPSFELFLLLHYPNSYKDTIEPLKDEFLKKENLTKKNHLITKKFNEKYGINSKHNSKIGDLIKQLNIAIIQEKELNQDIHNCKGRLTSNIGQIIQSIIDDNCSN